MNKSVTATCCGLLLLAAAPLVAAHEGDAPVSRDEIREKKEDLRDLQREYKEQERKRRARARRPRAWLGVQAGMANGSVDTCGNGNFGSGCDQSSTFGTYSANVTLLGPGGGMRLRAARGANKGHLQRMPYEEAALAVFRFGHSDWYGGVGWGRIMHPHDDYVGDLDGVSYDVFWAPASRGAAGFELSFHGLGGEDGGYGSVNLGLRFGSLR